MILILHQLVWLVLAVVSILVVPALLGPHSLTNNKQHKVVLDRRLGGFLGLLVLLAILNYSTHVCSDILLFSRFHVTKL